MGIGPLLCERNNIVVRYVSSDEGPYGVHKNSVPNIVCFLTLRVSEQ
jgi:hypothetical protein